MIGRREVTITLSESQVARVVHEAGAGAPINEWLRNVGDAALPRVSSGRGHNDHSRVLLTAIRVLIAFPLNGIDRELADVARELKIPKSTVHRHATTWIAVGALEQNPRSRRYRRTLPHNATGPDHDVKR
jgi:hypothetical protein